MVDAGLVYWEIGKKDEGVRMYTRAAELGDPAGQCNLGISYLQGTSSTKKWERQKNKPDEASEQGAVAVAYQVAVPFANLGVWLRSLWLDSVLSLRLIRVQSLRLIKVRSLWLITLSGLSQNNSANVSLGLDVKLLSQNNSANEAPGLDVKLLSQNNFVGEALELDGKLLSQNNSANVTPGLDSKLLFQNNSRNEALRLDDKLPSQDNFANQDIDEVREKVAELLNTSVS
uniref:Uncharacterized protein n=1 Tax=Tanacetum cinerariifolium TaxID=118510 RepID=A0A6L2M4T0_TANCI|nr:hypothetical protein [Tanacetum cinerariifolium]